MDRTEQSLLETATRFLELRAELQSLQELVNAAENSAAGRCVAPNRAQQDSLTSAEPCCLGLPRYGGKQRRPSVSLPAGITLRRVSG